MFSWRHRVSIILTTLTFAGSAFLITWLILGKSLQPTWPYVVAMLIAGLTNQAFFVWIIPRLLKR